MATHGGSSSAVSTAAQDVVARAHAGLLTQHDLQFDFTPFQPPPEPGWLKPLLDLLKALGPVFKYVFWAGIALGAAAILFFIAREVLGAHWRWPWRRAKPAAAAPDWRPTEARARTLLEDADRLAAQGRFDEAVHLLLFRSIEDIDGRWPGVVKPALTSRDIAGLPAVPDAVRSTFAGIAQVVERSFFGGRRLAADDFHRCREAYRAFALPAAA